MTDRQGHVFIAAAAFLVLVAAPVVRADSSLFGGFGFPTGEFAEATTSGWSLGGYATSPVLPRVDIGGFVAYTDFVVDTRTPGVGAQFGATLNAWEIEALGQVDIRSLKGFLGLGVANYSGVDDAGASQRKTDFAWQIGVAARLDFLEGRLAYHQISTAGGSASWIGLTAGLLF